MRKIPLQPTCLVDTDAPGASTADLAVSPGWHSLELDSKAAVGVARWGAVMLASSPSGALWADDFASRRTGPIGAVLAESIDLVGNGAIEALFNRVPFLRAGFGFTGPELVTDNKLILRHLSGLTSNPLAAGAVGPGAGRSDATTLLDYLLALG